MKQKQLILAAMVMAGCLYGCGASEATSDEPSGDAFAVTTSGAGSISQTDTDTAPGDDYLPPATDTAADDFSLPTQENDTTSGGGNINGAFVQEPELYPFDRAPRNRLTASNRKVFAHYFTPYPVSINNKVPEAGYYRTNYLNPYGENGKFLSKGGLLRQKPLDRAPVPEYEPFNITDMRHEVRMAAAMGLDGFAVDILDYNGTHWRRTLNMIDIAAQEFDDFYVLVMPDMNSLSDPGDFVKIVRALNNKPAAYRLADGTLVVAPYLADNYSPTWWVQQVDKLRAEGIKLMLWPVYQGWGEDLEDFISAYPSRYRDYLYGVSDWGPRTPTAGGRLGAAVASAHAQGVKWMSPVAPQDMRPKSMIFTEAGNSEALRNLWMSAINGGADWVQLISWNDYSEATEIAPSTGTGFGFYDLSTYYVQWFKLGRPAIKRDAVYAFYRPHHSDAPLAPSSPQSLVMQAMNGEAPRDQIEMVAFLKAPAKLQIEINGYVYEKQAAAGMAVFRIPLTEGTPIFNVVRNGKVVESMRGAVDITGNVEIQNLLYHGMSSRRQGFTDTEVALSWPWRYGSFTGSQQFGRATEASPFTRRAHFGPHQYKDVAADKFRGFGYSFLPADSTRTTSISFDFKIKSISGGSFTYRVHLAGSDQDFGARLSIAGEGMEFSIGNRMTGYSDYVNNEPLTVDQWYRVDLSVNRLDGDEDTYRLRLTDTTGKVIQSSALPFERDLDELATLLFVCDRNINASTRILVDNVRVSTGSQ